MRRLALVMANVCPMGHVPVIRHGKQATVVLDVLVKSATTALYHAWVMAHARRLDFAIAMYDGVVPRATFLVLLFMAFLAPGMVSAMMQHSACATRAFLAHHAASSVEAVPKTPVMATVCAKPMARASARTDGLVELVRFCVLGV